MPSKVLHQWPVSASASVAYRGIVVCGGLMVIVVELELGFVYFVVVEIIVVVVIAREVVVRHVSHADAVQIHRSIADWIVGDDVLVAGLSPLQIIPHPSTQNATVMLNDDKPLRPMARPRTNNRGRGQFSESIDTCNS